jgi:hypothetical protein
MAKIRTTIDKLTVKRNPTKSYTVRAKSMMIPDLLEKIQKIEKEISPPMILLDHLAVPHPSADSFALKKCMISLSNLEHYGDLPELSDDPIIMEAIPPRTP